MILEEETYKKFGYYSTVLSPRSHKKIIAKCDNCGAIRENSKSQYRSLCFSCVRQLIKGKNNPNWKGGKTKRVCKFCGNSFFTTSNNIKRGYGFYCSKSCAAKSRTGAKANNWQGGNVIRVCKTCGKEFEVCKAYIKTGRGFYCCGYCVPKPKRGAENPNWRGGGEKMTCCVCEKEFTVPHSKSERQKNNYCSQKCFGIVHSKSMQGSNNPKWSRVTRNCLICGKEFETIPSKIKNHNGKFCSRKCFGAYQSKNRSGKNSPSWKGGKITRICETCGESFSTKPSETKKGWGRFCSVSCAIKTKRHTAPPQKTQPEIIFEDMCIKYNLPFRFVGDGALWIARANPDFIHTTRKVVVEIFGDYWHSPLLNRNVTGTSTVEGRRKQLKDEGYKLIVLWETDLKRSDADAFVLSTLIRNKIKV